MRLPAGPCLFGWVLRWGDDDDLGAVFSFLSERPPASVDASGRGPGEPARGDRAVRRSGLPALLQPGVPPRLSYSGRRPGGRPLLSRHPLYGAAVRTGRGAVARPARG